jgi:hypothetical protein
VVGHVGGDGGGDSVDGRLGKTYMCYHHHTVPGEVDVRLDGVCADLDGAAEGAHGVLGKAGLVATVGHGLRETMV